MRFVYFLLLATLSTQVMGKSIPSDYCFEDAAQKAGVNKDILMAIASQESSFKRTAVNSSNWDGSEDVGVMQINSSHFEWLKKTGISRRDLFNACVNIHVGALILKECIRIHGNTWSAVGAYNAGHAKTREAHKRRYEYASKVWRRYKELKKSV